MSLSSNNLYNGILTPNQIKPSSATDDTVLTYTHYFIEVVCNRQCTLTVFQKNTGDMLYATSVYIVAPSTSSLILQGIISGGLLHVQIKNNATDNATVNFSTVYK